MIFSSAEVDGERIANPCTNSAYEMEPPSSESKNEKSRFTHAGDASLSCSAVVNSSIPNVPSPLVSSEWKRSNSFVMLSASRSKSDLRCETSNVCLTA